MADYAELVFDIDSSQARGAAKALGDLNSAVIKAANEVSKLGTSLRGADGRFASSIKLTKDNAKEVERLAMAYNPAMAAQIRYRDEAIKTGEAVKAGVITENQRIEILQRVRSEIDGTAAALRKVEAEERKAASAAGKASAAVKVMGDSQKVATHHATNLSYQLNDIGMMMASGQSPFMLMIQQGPQVAQIFSTMNAEGQKIGPTLTSAFKSLLNPTTALTLAVIGGSAALVQWAVGSDKAADSAAKSKDKLDSLKRAYSDLASIQSRQSASLEGQIEQYGRYWVTIRAVTEQLAINAQEAARQESNAAISSLGFDPRALEGYENQIRAFMQARNDMSAESRQIAIEALGFQQESIDKYGLQYNEVQKLVSIQEKLKGNDLGLNERNRLSAEFNELLNKGAQNGAKLKSEMLAAGDGALKLTEEMSRAAANTEAANRAMARFSQTASSASLSHLVSQAAQLANNLRAASSIANALGGRAETFAGGVFDVVKGAYQKAMDKIEEIDANSLSIRPRSRPFSVSEDALWGPEAKGGRGGGGGGGAKAAERQAAAELKSAEKGFQSLRELLDKQSAYQVAEYEKRLGQLNAALGKQLIAEKSYQEMKAQLQLTYFGSEYEKNAVNYQLDLEQLNQLHAAKLLSEEQYQMARKQLQHDYYSNAISVNQNQSAQQLSNMAADFAQMNQLAGGGYDKLLRAQKAFAAGSALINAYLAATQALADPTVGFWGKFAAYAKVLAAGIGAVNAIKGAGSGGGGGGGSSSAGSVKQEPTKNVLIRLEGDDWLTGLAEQMMTQIYEASSNGRVIVSRDMS